MGGDSPCPCLPQRCPACEHCHILGKGWGHPTAAAAPRCRILPRLLSEGSPGPCLAAAQLTSQQLHPPLALSAGPAVQGCAPALRGSAACPCAHPVVQEHRSRPQKLQDPLLQSHAAWGYA